MKKAVLALLVCFIMIYSHAGVLPSFASVDASEQLDEKLAEFKQKYPHGSFYTDNQTLAGGVECFGFANELALYIYGCYPTASISAENLNFGWSRRYGGDAVDELCVGDVVRYRAHSVFITGIDGSTVYYAQANVPLGTNAVSYDNSISKSRLKELVSEKLTAGNVNKTGWVAHFIGFAPLVTSITTPQPYGYVGSSHVFSFPATYAKSYELTVTNTTTGKVDLHTTQSAATYKHRFDAYGRYLIEVTAHGEERAAFTPLYFDVYTYDKKPNLYVNGQNGTLAFKAQRLCFTFDAELDEQIRSVNLRVHQYTPYGIGLFYEKMWDGNGPQTISCTHGSFFAYLEITYQSGYQTISPYVEWTMEASDTKGDANNDGETDNLDAACVLKYDCGVIDEYGITIATADVNDDGSVDNLDAAWILKYDAGVISNL